MKYFLITAIAILFQWGITDLPAAEEDSASMKDLVLKKFDSNLDGTLEGLEKARAIRFLQEADKDGDGDITASEQAVAITALTRMRDPKKPVSKPASAKVMKGGGAQIKIVGRPTNTTVAKQNAEFMANQKKIDAKLKKDAKMRIGGVEDRSAVKRRTVERSEVKKSTVDRSAVKRGATKTVAAVPVRTRKYYENVTVIAVSGAHTMVPKGSIIHAPPALAKLIVTVPDGGSPRGKLLRWPEFRDKYPQYVKTHIVTLGMARGKESLKASDRNAIADSRKIVVAVIGGSPVTLLKPSKK